MQLLRSDSRQLKRVPLRIYPWTFVEIYTYAQSLPDGPTPSFVIVDDGMCLSNGTLIISSGDIGFGSSFGGSSIGGSSFGGSPFGGSSYSGSSFTHSSVSEVGPSPCRAEPQAQAPIGQVEAKGKHVWTLQEL